jgi:hypothetical protein
MSHTASIQPTAATIHAFGTFVSMGHFDPASALELIEAEQVTAMFPALPPLTQGVLNNPGYSPAALASRLKGGSRWRAASSSAPTACTVSRANPCS